MSGNRYLLDTNAIVDLLRGNPTFPDAIIAASALQNQAILITENTDFKRINELKVISIKNV